MRAIRGFGGRGARVGAAARRLQTMFGAREMLAGAAIGAAVMMALPQGAHADPAPVPAALAAPVVVPAPVMPAPAAGPDLHAAAMMRAGRLKQLDIMLMVTALRCRVGPDDFQADYHAFEAAHMDEINAASRLILADETARLGAGEGQRDMERVVTAVANRYGNGHPWLGCADLHHLAHDLAAEHSPDALIAEAAEVLDGDDGPKGVALAMLGR